jgi:L-seryl-tRNA(Ser) seleniumtransferase
MADESERAELRALPSVEQLLQTEPLRSAAAHGPRALAVEAARHAIERQREAILNRNGAAPRPPEAADLAASAVEELERAQRPTLIPVINATGVVVHTNLGRAPLAFEALEAIDSVASGYSNLEYELEEGVRGGRMAHLEGLLCELTGAEAAVAVNNNAAGVLLALAALARGREVVISRGQLVEIGGSFRIPDILEQSGAALVEVGTTNRTRRSDYEQAIGPETAALMRVHASNFRTVGFTEDVPIAELAGLGRERGIPVIDDLGSGLLSSRSDALGALLDDEPAARDSVAAGADVVCFSGDKLLGGPQAGIVVGRAELVERLRQHPLQRALRADKLTLAALEGTLALYLDAPERIPVLRMLREDVKSVRARAERLAELVGGEVEETIARAGGGALPLAELPSFACAVEEELAAQLRAGDPPVIAVVRDGRTLLDCRTLTDDETDEVAAAVIACR